VSDHLRSGRAYQFDGAFDDVLQNPRGIHHHRAIAVLIDYGPGGVHGYAAAMDGG